MTRKHDTSPKSDANRFSEGLPVTEEFMDVWRQTEERREIGRRLEKMRRDAELTQVALAERMGKDQAFVARMESGRGDMPKAKNIALYAAECGYATAIAFVKAHDNDLTLHGLQSIGQSENVHDQLEKVHDVALPLDQVMVEESVHDQSEQAHDVDLPLIVED